MIIITYECYAIGSHYFWNAQKAFPMAGRVSCVLGETELSCSHWVLVWGLLTRRAQDTLVWLVLCFPRGKAAPFGVSNFFLSFLLSTACPCLSYGANWYSSADSPGCGLA